MLYAVVFQDNPDKQAKRARHLADHLAFLEDHAHQIKAAGPLKEANSQQTTGGLWLVEVDDTQSVQTLIEADPFWPTGLRRSVQCYEWTQVFAEGKRLIAAP